MSLRIAIFVGMFPVISETFILRQITGLMDLGHQVHIFSDLPNEPEAPAQPEVEQYKLLDRTTFMGMPAETAPHEMPVWPFLGKTWPPGSSTPVANARRLWQAFPKWISCFARAPRLACRVLKSSEYGYQARSLSSLYRLHKCLSHPRPFDVCHAHFGPIGNSFRFVRDLWRTPLVVSFHGYDFSTTIRKEGPGVYERLFATADVVTVNSQFTRSCMEKVACPASKMRLLPESLNPAEFTFRERRLNPDDSIRVVSVGRLVEKKGHEFTIRALAQVKNPGLELHIVGDGPLRSSLSTLAKQLGVADRVRFHGAVPATEVRNIMASSHIFVLASVDVHGDLEGQGLVLQEAQASGLPVIATLHGPLPEGLLPDQSGYLVPEKDPLALAERILFLARHSENWPAMGRAGRAFVEAKYDSRKLNRELTALYTHALENFRKPST